MEQSHIFVKKCDDYSSDKIQDILTDYFVLTGRNADSLFSGKNILIKPNLCGAHAPQSAIVTHFRLVEELIVFLKNFDANICIGDNPIGKSDSQYLETLWCNTGFKEISQKYGIDLTMMDRKGFSFNSLAVGEKEIEYLISNEYLESDVVINMPKFKTHTLMGFTGAVKNLFGVVPGRSKVRLHSKLPEKELFAKLIVDILSKRSPELTIMDAVEGIEGNGPTTGGVKRKIEKLIIGNDPVLIDSFAGYIIGLNDDKLPINTESATKNIGCLYDSSLLVPGSIVVEDCIMDDYRLPTTFQDVGSEIIKKYFDLAKFQISVLSEKCTECLKCIGLCPVGAMKKDGEVSVHQELCIQCLCCQEICPSGAIEIKRSMFYNQLKALKKRSQ